MRGEQNTMPPNTPLAPHHSPLPMSQFHDVIEQQAATVFCNPDLFGAQAGQVVYVPPSGPVVEDFAAVLLEDEDLQHFVSQAIPNNDPHGQEVRYFAALEVPAEMSIDLERGAFKINNDRYEIRKRIGRDFALQTLLVERTQRTSTTPGGLKK